MKLLLTKIVVVTASCVNIGCTTIGQQIINRDGTIQIEQSDVNFGATNGGNQTYQIPPQNVIPVKTCQKLPVTCNIVECCEIEEQRYEEYLLTPRDRLVAKTGIDIIEYREPQNRPNTNTSNNNEANIDVYAETINVIENVFLGSQ